MPQPTRRPQYRLVDDLLVVAGLVLVLVVLASIDWRLAVGLLGVVLFLVGTRG